MSKIKKSCGVMARRLWLAVGCLRLSRNLGADESAGGISMSASSMTEHTMRKAGMDQ